MALAKARKLKNPVPPTPAALAEGKQIYGSIAKTVTAKMATARAKKRAELSTAPTDFTDAQKMDGITDGEFSGKLQKAGNRCRPSKTS